MELLHRSLVLRVKLERLLELMPRALVVAMVAKYDSPHDPVLSVPRLDFNTFLDFLDGFCNLTLLEQGKSPLAMAVVTILSRVRFGLSTYGKGLWIKLMQVEHKGKIIVDIGMTCVKTHTSPPVVHTGVVSLKFEICEAEIVLQLGILWIEAFCFLKGAHRILKVTELVKSNSQVEKALLQRLL